MKQKKCPFFAFRKSYPQFLFFVYTSVAKQGFFSNFSNIKHRLNDVLAYHLTELNEESGGP